MRSEAELAAIVEAGARLWNAGRFFEAHDKWEEVWQALKAEKKSEAPKDPRRDFMHGLILYAAAYVHWSRGNPIGVSRKLEDARRLLRNVPTRSWGLDLTVLRPLIEADLERGIAGGPYNPSLAPRLGPDVPA